MTTLVTCRLDLWLPEAPRLAAECQWLAQRSNVPLLTAHAAFHVCCADADAMHYDLSTSNPAP